MNFLINKEGKEIVEICSKSMDISDAIVVFNNEYAVPMKDLSFIYECKLNINGKEYVVQFDTIEKRNEFYNKIVKKIEHEKQSISGLMKEEILNKEKKLYQDIDLEVKKHAKRKKMD